MYRLDKTTTTTTTWRQDMFHNEAKNPSFSSTLLDQIYRSIDQGDRKSASDMKFYREATVNKKQSKSRASANKFDIAVEEQDVARRAHLLEKWVDKKVITEKVGTQWKTLTDKRTHHYQERESDALFFSSTSNSSESSSGGLSSSDTESMYGVRSRASSCFAPSRPKPVRTTIIPEKPDKTRRQSSILGGGVQMFECYSHNNPNNEEGLIKSKSRALKIYNNLKKVKQPISPGGKLTNFLNSLLNTKRSNKSAPSPVVGGCYEERKAKSGQASSSTCSSASSFSRSCLSKTSMRNNDAVKRTVRFYPVSVIVGEDSRPCGHKCLYEEEEEDTNLMAMSVPKAWKIGRSPPTKKIMEEDHKFPVMENKKDLILRGVDEEEEDDEDEDEDDDAASYSSSDLFELDHLAVIGDNNRYCEELPVYETTHFGTNRAIVNGLRI